MEKILPSTISKVNTDSQVKDKLQYDGSELRYTLINAIKEQQAQIEALKQKLEKPLAAANVNVSDAIQALEKRTTDQLAVNKKLSDELTAVKNENISFKDQLAKMEVMQQQILALQIGYIKQSTAQGTLQITSGAYIKTAGNANIVFNGMNVINNGSFIQAIGDGTTKLTGSVNTTTSGTGTTTLDKLEVALGSSYSNTLSTSASLKNVLTLSSGQLISNGF